MQDTKSVITHAVEGLGVKLAELQGVSVARFYQRIESDFYGKVKHLITLLGLLDKSRVRIIWADFNAHCSQALGENPCAEVSPAVLHSELSEAIHAKLMNLPPADRLREAREAAAALNAEIAYLSKQEIRQDNGFAS